MKLQTKRTISSFPALRIPLLIGVVFFAVVSIIGLFNQTSGAASLANWNAGRIMDDAVMTNKGAMSVSQIQSFLNAKVPTCDTGGTRNSEMNNAGVPDYNSNGSIQRWEWGKYRYNQTTFPCLKSYRQNNVSAAQLIYNAAQTYSINPQVLIVLLQKEQGLVTDTWPLIIQYRSATGYGCPDTAACDSQYYGLTNQLNWAARMFRSIMNASPGWYTPYVLGNNYIRYNPNSSCGGTTVNIVNRATQALYNYTPYQPNAAALQAGYGGGNSCSSYGNRNFYLYFNDWFGSSFGSPVYAWSVRSREAFSDSAYTTKIGNASINMPPNSDVYLKFTVKNTGNQTWYKEFARLGMRSTTSFDNDTWLSPTRPAAMQEESVPAGGTATFTFKATAPSALGLYRQTFGFLLEGQRWFPGSFAYDINVTTPDPYYNISPTSFNVYQDAAKKYRLNPANITAYTDSKLYVTVKFKNTGNQNLPASTTKIAATNPIDRVSPFHDASWLSTTRIANPTEGTILPNSTGTFNFTMSPPSTTGAYQERVGAVVEGVRWVNTNIGTMKINVKNRPPNSMSSGQTLARGDELLSADRRYRLVFHNDGNLVLYSPYRSIWASRTGNKGGVRIVLQGDGNLVMYNSAWRPLWHTRTSGHGSSRLIIQSDGNAVLYKSGSRPTWSTGTSGRL